jgi:hypothetical protein
MPYAISLYHFDGEKKVESFIIPLPILEKRLLYSRSNKTIDKPCIYTTSCRNTADGCRKMRFVPLFSFKTEAPSGEPKVSAFLYLASVLKEH